MLICQYNASGALIFFETRHSKIHSHKSFRFLNQIIWFRQSLETITRLYNSHKTHGTVKRLYPVFNTM